jgi:hypothetical protein
MSNDNQHMNSDENYKLVTNFSKITKCCCKWEMQIASAICNYISWGLLVLRQPGLHTHSSSLFKKFCAHTGLFPAALRILSDSNGSFENCLSWAEYLHKQQVSWLHLFNSKSIVDWVMNWEQEWWMAARRGSVIRVCDQEPELVFVWDEKFNINVESKKKKDWTSKIFDP